MKVARTVVVSDPLIRANVLTALAGPGAPAGIISCSAAGTTIAIEFESTRARPELIDALIEIETVLVPARSAPLTDLTVAAAIAGRALDEPALDAARIIETYLS